MSVVDPGKVFSMMPLFERAQNSENCNTSNAEDFNGDASQFPMATSSVYDHIETRPDGQDGATLASKQN